MCKLRYLNRCRTPVQLRMAYVCVNVRFVFIWKSFTFFFTWGGGGLERWFQGKCVHVHYKCGLNGESGEIKLIFFGFLYKTFSLHLVKCLRVICFVPVNPSCFFSSDLSNYLEVSRILKRLNESVKLLLWLWLCDNNVFFLISFCLRCYLLTIWSTQDLYDFADEDRHGNNT